MAQEVTMPLPAPLGRPPDVRGPTAPVPLSILLLGGAALAVAVLGSAAIQAAYALAHSPFTPECLARNLTPQVDGALGVCHIFEALTSGGQTIVLVAALVLGAVATGAGLSVYRRMDTKRRREHAITGAVLGILAVAVAAFLLWFRTGRPDRFAFHFLNFERLTGSGGLFVRGAKNTIVLAFVGELGGIVLGLVLAVLTLSGRRVVRAPARIYINFFRGTPLIWQLQTGSFLFLFGLGLRLPAFTVAMIIFALNTGAYTAEVFRAGIQSIERGQIEAARSLGMSYTKAMRYAIVPQAVRRVIPPLMNEFVILIKDTSLITILGLVATDYDLFTTARQGYSSTANATFFTAVAAGYLVVTLPLIRLVNIVERRLRSGLVTVG